jgi:hypothetical protein
MPLRDHDQDDPPNPARRISVFLSCTNDLTRQLEKLGPHEHSAVVPRRAQD